MEKEKKKKPFYKKWWFWLIIVIVVLGVFGSSGDENDEASQEKSQIEQMESAKQEENRETINKMEVGIGEDANYRGTSIKVDEIKWIEPDEYMDVQQGEKVLGVKVTIKNNKTAKINYNAFDFKLNVDGRSEDATFLSGNLLGLDGEAFESGELDKDASYTAWLTFNANPNASKIILEYRGNAFSNNAKIKVNLK